MWHRFQADFTVVSNYSGLWVVCSLSAPPRPTPSPVSLSTGRAWDSRPTSGARQSRWDVTLVIILYEVVTSVFVQTVSDDAT